jgi:hypothetical protein
VKEKYCPNWIFDAVVAEIGGKYIASHYSIESLSAKYSRGLSKIYFPIEAVEIQATTETLLEFLLRIDAGEAAFEYLLGFAFYRVNYSSRASKRNLKPTFSKIESGSSERQYNGRQTLKMFRAYCFARRSDVDIPSSPGWTLAIQRELEEISKISSSLTESF